MGMNAINAQLKKHAVGFDTIDDFKELIDSVKNKKVVMLGECSHGTKEFYEWRAKISQELIEHHGFSFISVEGDWPACHAVNQSIKNNSSEDVRTTLKSFSRWPTWMWANEEVIPLIEWLKTWNIGQTRAGFHGLDVYSLYESIDQIKKVVGRMDVKLLDNINDYYSCFDPYRHDEKAYVRSLLKYPEGCAEEAAEMLEKILSHNLKSDPDFFDVIQNGRIIRNAERYYRAMITGEDSWNIRDYHMMETLERLLEFYGPQSKGIVWAHNTHIGDFRATDMLLMDQVNIGGLARKRFGENEVSLVGFTTYSGKVTAAGEWDGPIEEMNVPEGMTDSFESILHEAVSIIGRDNYYLNFQDFKDEKIFKDYIGHRAIGVVYHPLFERRGNYVPSLVSKRYDSMVFFDKTSALTPLTVKFDYDKIPETYPFGDRI